jgi:hypothetical protein
VNRPGRPTPQPLTKTERQALEDLIRRGARALNPTEGNRLLRLLELDQGDRAQERRTAGAADAHNQKLTSQLKVITAARDHCVLELGAAEDELAQWRQADARVRALHREEYGLCAACTDSHGVPWPCPTINALNGGAECCPLPAAGADPSTGGSHADPV